ncbi:hypothetical protein J1N35_024849 [Gossypium stocksii]|uniref:Retrotransposon gag domain-containing protein n=1 Tax=Gossypium stocksii TaxID=47602 RepID=A0A9D3V5I5_9ROSI|nr:hypothetical protein J1N35_024849 [Gossypium stocksii]
MDTMQGVLNTNMDGMTGNNDALKVMVSALKEHIQELKGELIIYKATFGNEVLAATPKLKLDVLKPKEFNGMRSAKDVDKFLWGMAQYFHSKGIIDDASKTRNKVELPLRLGRSSKVNPMGSFAKDEARAKLRQQSIVREYMKEFNELMLQIFDLGENEEFYFLMNGLKPWTKTRVATSRSQTTYKSYDHNEVLN